MIDPYRVLGVDLTADDEAIRESPPERDRERFESVRTAYEAVRDQRRRIAHELFDLSLPSVEDVLSAISSDLVPQPPTWRRVMRVLGGK